jgi:UDP:flavonoid glycosyltransferase YjiC (YdhE family)
MAKFLFTMLPANDLGLPTRLVPIARALADRGHVVAVFNPAPVPARLINDAGLKNLPMPSRPMPDSSDDLAQASSAWDVEQMFGALFGNEEFVRAATAANVDVVRDFDPDVVGYLRSARRVAESMRKFGGAQEAAERIERFAGVRS